MKSIPNSFSVRSILVVAVCGTGCSFAGAQSANNDCNAPEAISGYGVTGFTTVGATTDGIAAPACLFFSVTQIFNDIWYCWTAPTSDLVTISLCGASYDTKLAVYGVCTPCPDPSLVIACNDDFCALHSSLTFVATGGQSYTLRLGAYAATGTGTGNITIASGWLHEAVNPANNHRYVAYVTTSWNAAEATAVAAGGHLATLNDAEENAWIQANFGTIGGTDRRSWIGINDAAIEGVMVWSSGETVTYTNWNPGEPNNGGAGEDYVEFLGSNGKWNDLNLAGAGLAHIGIAELGVAAPLCPADFDQDGVVGGSDIAVILSNWGGGGAGDLDGDGVVAGPDLTTLLSAWGVCP